MKYQKELEFFQKLLTNFNLPYHYIEAPFTNVPDFDLGIRRFLEPDFKFDALIKEKRYALKPNTIYYLYDKFRCSYIVLQFPDTEVDTYLSIGPYLVEPVPPTDLYRYAEKFNIPPETVKQIENYFYSLPLIYESGIITNLVTTLGEILWGDVDNFSFESINPLEHPEINIDALFFTYEEKEPPFSVKLLEERYEKENALILAVSQGQYMKAEKNIDTYAFANLQPRTAEPLRNDKNYTIVLNTLLRKAAETGSVHPFHIDALSSRFARKIETVTSRKEIAQLQKEMVHKYCILVKNHSLKGYSLLVRKVLTQIDVDLTANLSLNALASDLNVNSSYLSTLFKKETGITLTEHVNRKRIEHAIFLLNSSSMQIQTIAQHCGISDVNYFTKLFKKQIGKTPKEYRESISQFK